MLFPKQTSDGPNVGEALLTNLKRSLSFVVLRRGKIEGPGGFDVHRILDSSFPAGEYSPGAVLSRLPLGGLTNALAGVEGGIVDVSTCLPLDSETGIDALVPTAGNVALKELIRLSKGLHRSIAAR